MSLIYKQPLAISAALLGLSLAATGCASANSQTTPMASSLTAQSTMPAKTDRDKAGYKKHQHGDRKGRGMHAGGHKGGMGMAGMMKALNLTDAQKAQVQQLRTQNQAKMQQLHATLKQYDDTIAKQKQAGASTASLLALYQQKQAAMKQFFSLREQQQQQFLNILTPEQQLKLYEARNKPGHKGPRGAEVTNLR